MTRILPSARCLAVFLFFAAAVSPTVLSQQQTPQSVVEGGRLFRQSCAACHDTVGAATWSGPGLKNYYHRQPRLTDSAVRETILQGRGKMPGFSTFSKSQMNDLIDYLKTL